jgi:hypothetical protein
MRQRRKYTQSKATLVERFDAPEELHDYLKDVHNIWRRNQDSHWGASWEQCCNNLLQGDTTNLDAAMAIIDKMQDAQLFSEGMPVYAPSVVGAFPNVPAFMMGHPMDMFSKQMSQTDALNTPLTIYIETTVSGGVSVKDLRSRGVAALAFALAMNNIRPVEIYTVSGGLPSGGKTSIVVTRIASAPMDIARAVFMLTDEAFARKITFAAMCNMSGVDTGYISWPWNGYPTYDDYKAKMRDALEMQPQDVLISGGHLNDKLMQSDPIQWVRNMIDLHSGKEGIEL